MEVRPIGANERNHAYELWNHAFKFGDVDAGPWESWVPLTEHAEWLGAWDGKELAAAAAVIDYQLQMGDAVAGLGGIAAVACRLARRGQGLAATLLRAELERMRARGQAFSMLFPFSWAFYRAYGWEAAGTKRVYRIAPEALPASAEGRHVRDIRHSDRVEIERCYADFTRHYRGALVRPAWYWDTMLAPRDGRNVTALLYERAGTCEGYILFRGGTQEQVRLREFVATTGRSRAGLLAVLRRLAMNTSQLEWTAPVDDGLWHTLYEKALHTEVVACTQARIVDVPGALGSLPAREDNRLTTVLAVRDAHAPWNAATWRVTGAEGRLAAIPTADDPGVTMDVRALTLAVLGSAGLAALRHSGLVDVADEGQFAALDAMLAGPPMWLNDSF